MRSHQIRNGDHSGFFCPHCQTSQLCEKQTLGREMSTPILICQKCGILFVEREDFPIDTRKLEERIYQLERDQLDRDLK